MKIKTIEISGFRQISNATFNLEDNYLCKKTRVWISLDFMQRIHEYTKITELSVEIVNELIDRIIIHKPEGNKRNRILKIEIHYNFIGNLDK